MGARVYDPYTGTFTQPDPILGGGATPYGYTNGDPVNETDLTGKVLDEDPAESLKEEIRADGEEGEGDVTAGGVELRVGGSIGDPTRTSESAVEDPTQVRNLTPAQVSDLARNAGYIERPGNPARANPAVRYYKPGTNGSQGFRVLPEGVRGQTGVKGGPYLKYFGGANNGVRVTLRRR